jgi:hypothetical protein
MIRPMCKSDLGADASADVFGFGGAPEPAAMQNLMVMMTAPWLAFWALNHELAEETLRNAFGG